MVTALSTLVAQVRQQEDYHISAEALLQDMVCARADPAFPLPLPEEPIKTRRFSLELAADELQQLHAGTVLREMVSRVNAIFSDLTTKGKREILVIADGLDKIDPALAEDIFDYASVMTGLKGRAVYTVPYGFYKSAGQLREDFEVEELPNVRLHPHRHPETRYEPGFTTLREVAYQRIKIVGGDSEIIEPEALDLLIAMSGGVLRGFIKLMRSAMLQAEYREKREITFEDAKWAVLKDRRMRSAVLAPVDKEYLRKFREGDTMEAKQKFLTQVHQGRILAYAEAGQVWYAVHPNLVPLLKMQE
jgi:hypothetical protein